MRRLSRAGRRSCGASAHRFFQLRGQRMQAVVGEHVVLRAIGHPAAAEV
jgi:hypothetical protein